MSDMRAFRSILVSIIILVLVWAVPAYSSHGRVTVAALAIDPQTSTTIYAGTYDGGVFRSTDGGASWTATGLTNIYVLSLAIDPQTPTALYAGTGTGAVYRSTDGGATWAANWNPGLVTSGTCNPCGAVLALAIDPLVPTTIFGGKEAVTAYWEDGWFLYTLPGNVIKSSDGAVTWGGLGLDVYTAPDQAVASLAVAVRTDPQTPTTLYAGTYGSGVFKSPDGGAIWSATGLTYSYVPALVIDPQTPTTLYAGILGGVYKSLDGGASWNAIGLTNFEVWALAIDPQTPTTLYAGTYGGGVYKSLDGGASWNATGLSGVDGVLALAIDPQTPTTLYAGTGSPLGTPPSFPDGVYKSTDGGANWSATGPITWPHISSVSLNPTSVVGGSPSTGTVTLSAAAPADGAVVVLGTDTNAATVPANVTVAAGAISTDFTTSTNPVMASTAVTMWAFYAGAGSSAVLTVTPNPDTTLSSVSLNPTSVTAGSASTGTVILNKAAPAGGAVVALSSSNPTIATVPVSVTVGAGTTTANFTVSTRVVAASTTVTISGAYGGVASSAVLTVIQATTTLSSVSLNPTSVIGGTPSTGTLTVSAVAPAGGVVVALASSNTAIATVPASVTVAAGATTENFTVFTSSVTASTAVTISAVFGGVTKSAVLTVSPPPATLSSLSLNPTSVGGGNPSTGTVTLSAAAQAGGAVVALASSNTAVTTVPASVTVAAGATSATFTVSTTRVTASTTATISATFDGVTRSAELTVTRRRRD